MCLISAWLKCALGIADELDHTVISSTGPCKGWQFDPKLWTAPGWHSPIFSEKLWCFLWRSVVLCTKHLYISVKPFKQRCMSCPKHDMKLRNNVPKTKTPQGSTDVDSCLSMFIWELICYCNLWLYFPREYSVSLFLLLFPTHYLSTGLNTVIIFLMDFLGCYLSIWIYLIFIVS